MKGWSGVDSTHGGGQTARTSGGRQMCGQAGKTPRECLFLQGVIREQEQLVQAVTAGQTDRQEAMCKVPCTREEQSSKKIHTG